MIRHASSHLLALGAIVLALAGTSYAAAKITGKSISDGTVTGRDVKNRSLHARDLKRNVLADRATAGPQGPAGPQGDRGPAGERGPSDAIVFEPNDPDDIDPNPTLFGPLRLPAGSWALDASGQLDSTTQNQKTVSCQLRAGPDVVAGTGNLNLGPANTPGSEAPISLTGAATITQPEEAFLACITSAPSVTVKSLVLRAIRVGDLEQQTD